MKYSLISVLCSLALVASCGEATKTVSDFRADDAARVATLAACRDNPAEWDTTPNCGNAEAATRQMIEEVHLAAATEAKPLQDQIRVLSTQCTGVSRDQFYSCREENGKAQAEIMAQTKAIAERSNARKSELSAQIQRME